MGIRLNFIKNNLHINPKSFIIVIIQFICIFFLIFTGRVIPSDEILLLFEITFLLLGLWAILEMKFSFNIFPQPLKNKSLVITGPYKFIRHPMYTAIIFTTLIWIVIDFTYIRFFVWIVLVVILNMKLEYEEKILGEKFSNYISYKDRTKKIIPFIY